MSFKAGDCYRNENNPPPPQHYWFILSDPQVNPNSVMAANITEWKELTGDSACRLQPNDHPRIYKASYVNFEDAKMYTLAQLAEWEKQRLIVRHEDASPDLLELMQQGVLESEFCSNKFKRLLSDQGLPWPGAGVKLN